jgi:hypothetical protein
MNFLNKRNANLFIHSAGEHIHPNIFNNYIDFILNNINLFLNENIRIKETR